MHLIYSEVWLQSTGLSINSLSRPLWSQGRTNVRASANAAIHFRLRQVAPAFHFCSSNESVMTKCGYIYCVLLFVRLVQSVQTLMRKACDGLRNTVAHTYVDVVLLITLVQVVHDRSFVQLSQRWHVLHPVDAGLVHGVHPLPVDLSLLQIQHLRRQWGRFTLNRIIIKKEMGMSWSNRPNGPSPGIQTKLTFF